MQSKAERRKSKANLPASALAAFLSFDLRLSSFDRLAS
jgi:hypothetical protein